MLEPGWISFYGAAIEIVKRSGGSGADAQATLRRACADERIRSMLAPFETAGGGTAASIKTISIEPPEHWTRIKPSEWEGQPDYAADGWMVMVNEDDFQHWLNGEPQQRKPRAVTLRRKRNAAAQAIAKLWPDGIPEDIADKKIGRKVIARLKEQGHGEVSLDTILRAAGRKR